MQLASCALTLVIPAYNEERRIAQTLDHYLEFFIQQYSNDFEIIVVLNGCRDNTEHIVKDYAKEYSQVHYVNFPAAIGKGGALIQGFKMARGKLVGFTDADAATKADMMSGLYEIISLLPNLDCAIGSRRIPGSIVTAKTLSRKVFSWGFNFGVNVLFGLSLHDTQCGAKVVRYEMLKKIMPELTISDMSFDVNFLVAIKRAGGSILEVPITWTDQPYSTISKPFKTSFQMAASVVRLAFLYSSFKSAFLTTERFINWMRGAGLSMQQQLENEETKMIAKEQELVREVEETVEQTVDKLTKKSQVEPVRITSEYT